jgi:predicted anti-sigma-YlaC factor YlaD
VSAVCAFRAHVDNHFAARNSVAEELELRRHLLEGCASCRQRYTRQAMLARVLPGSRSAENRLAVALGLARRS